MTRLAVVLLNLGGPDGPDAVEPFLTNFFRDRAIIDLPAIVRWPLAWLIAKRRGPVARGIYAKLGGGSPLRVNTEAQAKALERALGQTDVADDVRVFIAMRYWHPMSDETAKSVAAFAPDRILLLPLYPQFSTTTTASSVKAWRAAAQTAGIEAPTRTVCCYATESAFIDAHARLIRPALRDAAETGPIRLLFSAHGLPKKVIAKGDPYQWQIEQTAAATADALARPGLDWQICYQSRVGPLEWIGPSLDEALEGAARDGLGVVVVPIAFVSEHSETLVELDIEYAKMAEQLGIKSYIRVAALGVSTPFIDALAGLAIAALDGDDGGPARGRDTAACPGSFGQCLFANAGANAGAGGGSAA